MTALEETPPESAPPSGALRFVAVRRVPFNFRLGEWHLFSLRRPLAVFDYEAGATDCDAPPPALPVLAQGADGYLVKGLPAALAEEFARPRPGWFQRVQRRYPRHLVDLTTGFEAYLAKFSAKTRSTLKRKLRKFAELSGGTIAWKEFRTPDELEAFFPLARTVSAKTYQERLLGAGLPDGAAFRAETTARARRGDVRAYILFLEARPVSYLFLPVERGRLSYAYLGYDPACAEHSPGTVLQLLAMERLFAEPGLTLFDFTEGEGQHKQLFATHTQDCVDVLILKRKPTTVLLARAHAAFERAEAGVSQLLAKLGVKKRLKKLLRVVAPARD